MTFNFTRIPTSSKKFLVKTFIGSITKCGKKTKAIKLFTLFLYDIKLKFNVYPLDLLELVIDTIRPKVFLISKKISGSTVRIPTPIPLHRSYSIATKWFLSSVEKRKGGPFNQLIFAELLDIYANPVNSTLKKRDEYHKLAKLNRPFLRYNKF